MYKHFNCFLAYAYRKGDLNAQINARGGTMHEEVKQELVYACWTRNTWIGVRPFDV